MTATEYVRLVGNLTTALQDVPQLTNVDNITWDITQDGNLRITDPATEACITVDRAYLPAIRAWLATTYPGG